LIAIRWTAFAGTREGRTAGRNHALSSAPSPRVNRTC